MLTETKEQILEMGEKRNVKIFGLDEVPHIIQGRPLFDFGNVDPEILNSVVPKEDHDGLWLGQGFHNIAVFEDGRVEGLKTVSSQYKAIQHGDAILKLFEAIPEKFELQTINISGSDNGGRCFFDFLSGKTEEIVKGKVMQYRASGMNSADLSKRFSIWDKLLCQWCSNGAMAPYKDYKGTTIRKLHKQGLNIDLEINSFLETLDDSMNCMSGWKRYAEKKLTAPDIEKVFEQLEVGPRVQEELLDQELRGDNTNVNAMLEDNSLTAFDLYNSFTQRITDSESDESVKIENGQKVTDVFEELVAA